MIYRVCVLETLHARANLAYAAWTRRVVYCGTDRLQARITFLKEQAEDHQPSDEHDSGRRTVVEIFGDDPDSITDLTEVEE